MVDCFIDFKCTQQDLQRVDDRVVASHCANVLKARFDLCPKWDGLAVYAKFHRMGAVYDVPLVDGIAEVPWEVIIYTGFHVSLFASIEGGGRMTSASIFVDVRRSIEAEGCEPIPSTPALLQRYEGMVQACIDTAASIRADAENGAFNGEPFNISRVYESVAEMEADESNSVPLGCYVIINTGDATDAENARLYQRTSEGWAYIVDMSGLQGSAGTLSIGSVTSGETAQVSNSGTSTDAVFDFVLPKGDKGDKGDKGEPGTGADVEEIPISFIEAL